MNVARLAVSGLLLLLMTLSWQDVRAQSPTTPTSARELRVTRHLERIRREPPALRAFLRAMPKGADLHTHLSGAIYAESYIRWAADLPLCIELSTSTFVEAVTGTAATCRDPATQRPAAQILQNPVLYRTVIDALSTRNWNPARAVGHFQFFDAFGRFDAVTPEGGEAYAVLVGRAVAEVMHRSALQNVMHLELMVSLDGQIEVSSDGISWDTDAPFPSLRERLLSTTAFRQHVDERRRWLDAVGTDARAALGCGTPTARPGCDISVRFIAYSLRGLAPEQVFARAMFAFELAAADPRVVGVNLVMPEDWYIPMRDYDLHMRMFRFFRKLYPTVNVALHAGELAFGLVPPESLGIHIRQAINVGGAQRIGHGTDVMYDADPAGLMRDMARRRIPVEISLSSSDLILGVRGERHPIREYLRAGVPVVIATDDEGVARSDLTNEYQRAVEEQGLTYGQLKQISRNSIEYSFLVRDEKARVQRALESAFERFEAGF
jgi:hypothetical protein